MCIATMFVQALLLAIAATVPLAHAEEEYRCWQPYRPGNCYPPVIRHAYLASKNACEPFIAPCDRGNGNSFDRKEQCEDTCVKKARPVGDACSQGVDLGSPCLIPPPGPTHRVAYFATANSCAFFGYKGCGGNDNKFGSLEECKIKCVKT